MSNKLGQHLTGNGAIYGGVLDGDSVFNPHAPPRKQRPLRTPVPELHTFNSLDDVPLLLTRYKGGTKGPVVLAHGLGVSSRIFSTDTIETNLTEYLVAHGYDVRLLDFRVSTALPASLPWGSSRVSAASAQCAGEIGFPFTDGLCRERWM